MQRNYVTCRLKTRQLRTFLTGVDMEGEVAGECADPQVLVVTPGCVKRQAKNLLSICFRDVPLVRDSSGYPVYNKIYMNEKVPVRVLKKTQDLHSITETIKNIREKMQKAALRAGRDPDGVRLVAATKTVPANRLEEAYAAGVRIFGENRLQEAQEKIRILGPKEKLAWHFIGRMQRRKLKNIVGRFTLLHSVENIDQAKLINAAAERLGIQQEVLLEVNVAGEASKGGFTSQEVEAGIAELDRLRHVSICGLMTLPPWKKDPEEIRPYFTQLCRLRDRLAQQSWHHVRLDQLSMGMSHDYEIAIEEGATMVRLGTAIFGERSQPASNSLDEPAEI